MAKRKSVSDNIDRICGSVAAVRRDINRAVWKMAVNQLPPEVRELLSQTRGNPHLETKMKRLINALIAADDAIAHASSRLK